LKKLDVTILHEFVDKIYISATVKKHEERKIHIVYNFVGAFDFVTAIEQSETNHQQKNTA
jgi:hypothetical protein